MTWPDFSSSVSRPEASRLSLIVTDRTQLCRTDAAVGCSFVAGSLQFRLGFVLGWSLRRRFVSASLLPGGALPTPAGWA